MRRLGREGTDLGTDGRGECFRRKGMEERGRAGMVKNEREGRWTDRKVNMVLRMDGTDAKYRRMLWEEGKGREEGMEGKKE